MSEELQARKEYQIIANNAEFIGTLESYFSKKELNQTDQHLFLATHK